MAFQIFDVSSTGTGGTIALSTTDDALILAGVNVFNETGQALSASGNQHSVVIYGSLSGATNGMVFSRPASPNNHQVEVFIGSNGLVSTFGGTSTAALFLGVAAEDGDVTAHRLGNDGTIVSSALGIVVDLQAGVSNELVEINNNGLVQASNEAIQLQGAATFSLVTIKNTGIIRTTSSTGDAITTTSTGLNNLQLINSGKIIGSIDLALTGNTGNSLVDNTGGEIFGSVLFGEGGNIFRPGDFQSFVNGGSGDDTIDFSVFSSAVNFALDGSLASSHAHLSALVNFEALKGTVFADILRGNSQSNVISGFGGNDTLEGGGGTDTLITDFSSSTLRGGDGDDLMLALVLAGSETFSARNLTVDGGSGFDTVELQFSRDLTITLNAPATTGNLRINSSGVEEFRIGGGSGDAVTFHGDAGNNRVVESIVGLGFDSSTFNGQAGDDTYKLTGSLASIARNLNGGSGIDTLDLQVAPSLTLALDNSFAATGSLAGLVIADFENVRLGNGSNGLRGSAAANVFIDAGADIAGDSFDGSGGSDTVSYEFSLATVSTGLLTGDTRSNMASGDSYLSIENLTGSQSGDTLKGDDNANILRGLSGVDTLTGRLGNDILQGGAGGDTLNGDGGSDTASYGDATGAVKVFMLNMAANTGDALSDVFNSIENLTGSNHADQLFGDGQANSINGGLGSDIMNGGNGSDAYVANVTTDVIQESNAVLATGGNDIVTFIGTSGTFTLSANVERLTLGGTSAINGTGNGLANTLTGNAAANTLRGMAGVDTLNGLGGIDRFRYEAFGEAGDNIINFEAADFIELKGSVFTGLTNANKAANFVIRANNHNAVDTSDRLIFNELDDTLWYDSNGSTAGGTIIKIADLSNNFALTAADILIV